MTGAQSRNSRRHSVRRVASATILKSVILQQAERCFGRCRRTSNYSAFRAVHLVSVLAEEQRSFLWLSSSAVENLAFGTFARTVVRINLGQNCLKDQLPKFPKFIAFNNKLGLLDCYVVRQGYFVGDCRRVLHLWQD